jgi:uncharacterized membrane protein
MAQSPQVQFNIGDILSRSWKLYTGNLGVFLGGFVIIAVILGAANYALLAGTIVLQGPLMLGLYSAALKEVRGGHSEMGELFNGFQRFMPAFMVNLILSIFATIGFVLCVLPCFFVVILYMPLFCLLADDTTSDWWGTMERTRALVMDNLGQWLILGLVLIALNVAGALACGVGVFVSAPLSILAVALAYEQSMANAVIVVSAEEAPLP